MTEELKLCPFCGNTNISTEKDGQRWIAYCVNCQAIGPRAYTQFETIEAWNKRA